MSVSTSETACDSYVWDGVAYTVSGTYSNTYTNTVGCDSIHIINLTINNSECQYLHQKLLVIVMFGME